MDSLRNTYLGQYLLQEVVGRGAGAVVYKAFQRALNRRVAVKVLLRGLDPQSVSRFEREAQAIAGLQHPNILPIYDFGQQGGQRYFVMQYVEGGASLADLIARGPLEPVAGMRLLGRLLDALDYAHQQGVIHRDIKPSNILLPAPEWPLLADFGIAKLMHDSQLTPPGMVIGTAAYMAPEAALQRPLDSRADLYSAGVVLYEMLTGRVPFDAPTPLALLGQHVREPPPPPRSISPDVPWVAEAVAMRALAKDPAGRYQSAAEMRAALSAAITQVERASAQFWLLSQLDQGAASHPARSGYTTHNLAAVDPAEAPAPPEAPRRRRPPPPRARPPSGVSRPPALALVAGLLLVLVAGALVWGLAGRSATAPQPAAEVAATPPPTAPPTAPPTPASSPVATAGPPDLPATPAPPASPIPPAPPPTVAPAEAQSILLEDASWSGGYARSRGSNLYGGRTATWIYGTASDYSTMDATFEVAGQPAGEAVLRVEGMDSEGPARTPIRIAVNGVEIYRGPNPLPDDDIPYETGTWASETWRFDASLLRPGLNEVTISNMAEGAFGGPPFFMLDYAELAFGVDDS